MEFKYLVLTGYESGCEGLSRELFDNEKAAINHATSQYSNFEIYKVIECELTLKNKETTKKGD